MIMGSGCCMGRWLCCEGLAFSVERLALGLVESVGLEKSVESGGGLSCIVYCLSLVYCLSFVVVFVVKAGRALARLQAQRALAC